MQNTSPIIETKGLRKVFGNKVAVRDLSLTVERGEVFGFLGPNGAGKTTSVKMLSNLITPTGGEGYLFGETIKTPATRQRIGFLPEHFRFHDWLKADEFLRLHADLYYMPREITERRIPELLELVGLAEHRKKKLGAFSKGMLQRIGLAQALLNEPDLVILDEPTSGLDPVGRRQVRDIIRNLRERGTTVFLNSHFLSEVEITCDRVAFIKNGEIVRTSELKTLISGEMNVEIRAQVTNPEMIDGLNRWGGDIRLDDGIIHMTINSEADLPDINRYLVENGADVYAIRPEKISLEDLFIQIVLYA